MSNNIFDIIILNGRPASGKSEVIDYLKKRRWKSAPAGSISES
jgi:dephospho-CoA kinase